VGFSFGESGRHVFVVESGVVVGFIGFSIVTLGSGEVELGFVPVSEGNILEGLGFGDFKGGIEMGLHCLSLCFTGSDVGGFGSFVLGNGSVVLFAGSVPGGVPFNLKFDFLSSNVFGVKVELNSGTSFLIKCFLLVNKFLTGSHGSFERILVFEEEVVSEVHLGGGGGLEGESLGGNGDGGDEGVLANMSVVCLGLN